MNTLITPRRLAAFIAALILSNSPIVAQITYDWASATTGGAWTTNANWTSNDTPSTYPLGAESARLGNATASRVVTFSGSTGTPLTTSSDFIDSLQFTQTSAFNNQLTVQSALRVNNGFTLSASSGGSSTLFLANDQIAPTVADTTIPLTFTLGSSAGQTLTVGANGVLALGGKTYANNNVILNFNTGNILIDGGRLDVQQAVKNSAGAQGSVSSNLNGALTINSGTLEMGSASTLANLGFGYTTEARIVVGGNFTMNGGTIGSAAASQIWLKGATNTIASGSSLNRNAAFVMNNGAQSLTSAAALGTVILRGNDITTTLGVTGTIVGGANIRQVEFRTGGTTGGTLKLATDIATESHFVVGNAASSGTTNYVVDTNGYTLDLTRAGSRFEPGRSNNTVNTQWAFNGSGAIRAHSFRFDLTDTVGVSVGAGTKLIATANNVTSFLGYNTGLAEANRGTISASSVFIYDGGSGNTGFLNSNRALGQLIARTGTLQTNTSITAQGGIAIEAGAIFNAGFALTTPSLTFGVNGANFGTFSAASAYSITGQNLFFDFGTTPVNGTSFDFFTTAITGSAAGVSVTFSGLNAIALTSVSGTWTGTGNGFDYSFAEGTGILSIATSSVPEPSTTALLVGGAVLGICVFRRKSLRAEA